MQQFYLFHFSFSHFLFIKILACCFSLLRQQYSQIFETKLHRLGAYLVFGRQLFDDCLPIPDFLSKKTLQRLLQKLPRQKQFRSEPVRLDLLVVDRQARYRVPESDGGSVDIHLSFVKHEMPDFMGNGEPLAVDVVGTVHADDRAALSPVKHSRNIIPVFVRLVDDPDPQGLRQTVDRNGRIF